ncbi:stage II sporulation protein M [Mycobacterium sp. pUA109]|uniref:stage II sporulation protein M n=1 Tax=Mycobacterium sp. pUA109 TaxID=3238982 RepID=UPI00351B0F63
MDVDAFVLAHRATWDRLDWLVKKRRRLTGAEVDELVELYQRVSTHLSMLRSASSDSALVGGLSSLVARARAAVTGAHAPLWREFTHFWRVSFPVVAYRARWWWLATAAAFVSVTVVIAVWVARNPEVQATIGTPTQIGDLINHDFASYYSEDPSPSFFLHVFVNNVKVALTGIGCAILLGLPVPFMLFSNAANIGVIAGLMFPAGKGGFMLSMLTPHGLLELTAVFLAAAAGMRLGWTAIAPGDRPRGQALAEQARAVIAVAAGLVAMLLVAGLIEAFVTPARWPTVVRIGIGVLAEAAFLGYIGYFGRKADIAGQTGDVEDAPDVLPTR